MENNVFPDMSFTTQQNQPKKRETHTISDKSKVLVFINSYFGFKLIF